MLIKLILLICISITLARYYDDVEDSSFFDMQESYGDDIENPENYNMKQLDSIESEKNKENDEKMESDLINNQQLDDTETQDEGKGNKDINIDSNLISDPKEENTNSDPKAEQTLDSTESEDEDLSEKREASRFKNIETAMRGYNLLKGDPLVNSFDPGFRNKIFKAFSEGQTLDESITASFVSNCRRSLTSHIFTTTSAMRSELAENSRSGVNLQIGQDIHVLGVAPFVAAYTKIPPAFTRAWGSSRSFQEARSTFRQKHGSISLAEGFCIEYQVSLSRYQLPQFTTAFRSAIQRLYDVRSSSNAEKKRAFRNFISDFGTHYMIESQLGASFTEKTTYSGKITKDFGREQLKQCNYVAGSKIFGIQVEADRNTCSDNLQKTLKNSAESDVKSETITKGSRPTDIKDWVKQRFVPVPIKYTFAPIVNLFKKSHIDDRYYGEFGEEMEEEDSVANSILKWFMPFYHDICTNMGYDCTVKTGCGIDDKCPADTECFGNGPKHECTGWSSWEKIGTLRRRTRSCQGCKGNLIEEQDSAKISECTILRGQHGDTLRCPAGTVAVGNCGSGSGIDCGRGVQQVATMLTCCKVRPVAGTESNCNTHQGKYGALLRCSANSVVDEFCGSRGGGDCGHHIWNRIKCCDHSNVKVTSECQWRYSTHGAEVDCPSGSVMSGACGSGGGSDCPGRQANGAYCCKLRNAKAVDSCKILQGNYGKRLDCPAGYVATGACGSRGGADCGYLIYNRLKCCKVRSPSLPQHCSSKPSPTYGSNLICPSTNGKISFLTKYCGSGGGRDCAGHVFNRIGCCEMTGISADQLSCNWQYGQHGKFLECPSGYAMAGACGSGSGRDCQGSTAHGIYCCKVH